MRVQHMLTLAMMSLIYQPAAGQVSEFTDKSEWQDAVGDYSTITFTEVPHHTFITTQYAHLGVTFDDGDDFTVTDPTALPNDLFGITSIFDNNITLDFAEPIQWFAIDFPGEVQCRLLHGDQVIYTTTHVGFPGNGWFTGVLSDQPFDSVVIFDPSGGSFMIDDLHFGPPIPAPGPLALLGLAGVIQRRRRCE